MPAGFCRHLVGKTLINVRCCDIIIIIIILYSAIYGSTQAHKQLTAKMHQNYI